jgi:hypothetical protein
MWISELIRLMLVWDETQLAPVTQPQRDAWLRQQLALWRLPLFQRLIRVKLVHVQMILVWATS